MSVASVLDRFPTPPCAAHLGFEMLEADCDHGEVRIAFVARPEFCNPTGYVQGGFLTAMLDDCVGPAVIIATGATVFPTTIDLHVQFLAPAGPGALVGQGRVVTLGKTIGFVEATLKDGRGNQVARANASIRITPMDRVIAR